MPKTNKEAVHEEHQFFRHKADLALLRVLRGEIFKESGSHHEGLTAVSPCAGRESTRKMTNRPHFAHAKQVHSWSRFLSKFKSKHLKSEKREFMMIIKFFTIKKKFGDQRLKRFFRFSKKSRNFHEELRYLMGTSFAVTLRNGFLTAEMPKKRKITFLPLEVAKRPFGPAKAKSSRRVLRTKLLANFLFEAPKAPRQRNLQICAETSETARRAPLAVIFKESAFAPSRTQIFWQIKLKQPSCFHKALDPVIHKRSQKLIKGWSSCPVSEALSELNVVAKVRAVEFPFRSVNN